MLGPAFLFQLSPGARSPQTSRPWQLESAHQPRLSPGLDKFEATAMALASGVANEGLLLLLGNEFPGSRDRQEGCWGQGWGEGSFLKPRASGLGAAPLLTPTSTGLVFGFTKGSGDQDKWYAWASSKHGYTGGGQASIAGTSGKGSFLKAAGFLFLSTPRLQGKLLDLSDALVSPSIKWDNSLPPPSGVQGIT